MGEEGGAARLNWVGNNLCGVVNAMLGYRKYGSSWNLICKIVFLMSLTTSAWGLPPCNNPTMYRFITTAPLPPTNVGQLYLKQFQIVGAAGSVIYTIGDGALPPGLSLSSGGVLSGIPTTTGNYLFEVIARDNCEAPPPPPPPPPVGDRRVGARGLALSDYVFSGGLFSLTVNPRLCTPPQITAPSALAPATAGGLYSNQIQAAGQAPLTYEIVGGLLPPGLSMSNTGRISGTSRVSGTYSFTVGVRDGCTPIKQIATKTLSITVNPAMPPQITSPSSLPSLSVGQPYSIQLTAAGLAPMTYELVGGLLPPGLTMSTAGLIAGTLRASGTYSFAVRVQDSSLPTAQTSTKTFSLTVHPAAPPQITSPSPLPAAAVGQSYSMQLSATGLAPITYEIISGSLPTGLTITNTGRISGMPAAEGTYAFVVRVRDSSLPAAQVSVKTLTLTVNASSSFQITSPSSLPATAVGQPYSTQLAASGLAPMRYEIVTGSLPPGLGMSSLGGVSGVPITDGIYSFTVRAQDSSFPTPQIATKQLSIKVNISIYGSVAPTFYGAPIEIATTQALTYTFSAPGEGRTTISSMQGIFFAGNTQLHVNNTPITAIIAAGRGSATETITIYPSVMQKALSMGVSQISYARSFSTTSGTVVVTTSMDIRMTTTAMADLLITRMLLYFHNRQQVITIKRNDPTLRTYLDINYAGTGVLQGYWEVDGNVLTNVVRTISSGSTITLEAPAPPILPVYSPGSHRIRFVVTKPSQNISFPEISYYVSAEDPQTEVVKKIKPLNLLFPSNNGVVSYAPLTFLWASQETGIANYLLEFFAKGEEKTLFAAYTKNPSYRLPEALLKTYFVPGKAYIWKVKGFDGLNSITAESAQSTFTMTE